MYLLAETGTANEKFSCNARDRMYPFYRSEILRFRRRLAYVIEYTHTPGEKRLVLFSTNLYTTHTHDDTQHTHAHIRTYIFYEYIEYPFVSHVRPISAAFVSDLTR